MDTDELILQQAMLLRAQLCRVAAQTNALAARDNDESKLATAKRMVVAAAKFADELEYIMASDE